MRVSDVSEQIDGAPTTLRIEASSEEILFASESLVRRASPALSILGWMARLARIDGAKSLRSAGTGIPGGCPTVGQVEYATQRSH